jgi:hypothetical protein
MVTDAAHNVGVQTNSSSFLNTLYRNYCELSGSTKSSSFSAGLSAIIESVPLSLTGGSNDSSTEIKNFCKNYQSNYEANSASFDSRSIVVQKALESANQCLRIATKTQNTISYSIITPQTLAISFWIPSGQTLHIGGISHDESVLCKGSKPDGNGTVNYSAGNGQIITASVGSYKVRCDRKPVASQGGTSVYNATALIVDTNLGGVDIYWPQDTTLPITTASQIQASISGVQSDVAGLHADFRKLASRVDFNTLPVGTVIPWLSKDQPPEGWAKCDGSDISRCPDLRNVFLLGGTSADAGKRGGSQKMTIEIRGSTKGRQDGDGYDVGDHDRIGKVDTNVPLPPYVQVVYIYKYEQSPKALHASK